MTRTNRSTKVENRKDENDRGGEAEASKVKEKGTRTKQIDLMVIYSS